MLIPVLDIQYQIHGNSNGWIHSISSMAAMPCDNQSHLDHFPADRGKDAFETTTYVSSLSSVTLLRIFDVPAASAHLFFNSSMPKKCCWWFRKSGKPIIITLSRSLSFHPFTTCFERIDSRIPNYWVHMSSPPKKTVNPKLGGGPKNAWKIRRDESWRSIYKPHGEYPPIQPPLYCNRRASGSARSCCTLRQHPRACGRWVFLMFSLCLWWRGEVMQM